MKCLTNHLNIQKNVILRFTIILITFLSINRMLAQELEMHQWKNRLLLVVSENENSKDYKRQVLELLTAKKGLIDRQLIVYHVFPNKYSLDKIQYDSINSGMSSSTLYTRFNTNKEPFKVILIGLDGSVKLNRNTLLKTETLFNTIDAMPMRQLELRKD